MKNIKKILLTSLFGLGLALFSISQKADAACTDYYDVTYPSQYCGPQGFGSCTRSCPGDA